MNNSPTPKETTGRIKSIGLSGRGPNSGELTLVIGSAGKGENLYAGIIDDKNHRNGIEHGVFAGFVSIATLAYSTKSPVKCTYLELDKPRITGLVIA